MIDRLLVGGIEWSKSHSKNDQKQNLSQYLVITSTKQLTDALFIVSNSTTYTFINQFVVTPPINS